MNKSADLITATGVTILGVATGLSYDILLAGFAGGLVSLSFIEPQGIWRRIWTLSSATLLAGYTAPVALAWIYTVSPEGADIPPVFAGFCMGLFGQALIPTVLQRARKALDAPINPSQGK